MSDFIVNKLYSEIEDLKDVIIAKDNQIKELKAYNLGLTKSLVELESRVPVWISNASHWEPMPVPPKVKGNE